MNSNNKEIKEIREHLRICLLDTLNNLRQGIRSADEHKKKYQSYAITLFIATAGFVLSRKSPDLIFYFLPYIPIIIFGFLHAYQEFMVEREGTRRGYIKDIEDKLRKLYTSKYDVLIKLVEEGIFPTEFYKRGQRKILSIPRFFKEKVPGMMRVAISVPYLALYGGLPLIWTVIILIIYFC